MLLTLQLFLFFGVTVVAAVDVVNVTVDSALDIAIVAAVDAVVFDVVDITVDYVL